MSFLSSARVMGSILGVLAGAVSAFGQATERQKLFAPDSTSYDHFGGAVAVSGELAAVAAPLDDTAAGADAGSVSVYRRDAATGKYVFVQQLTASDGAKADHFGASLALSGNVLVVGAPWHDATVGADAGAAYAYRFDGASWIEEQKLASSDLSAGDEFGDAVATTGTTILVGAPQDDAPTLNSGSVYSFRSAGAGSPWQEDQKLIPLDGFTQDVFGSAIAIDGKTAIIGAPAHDVGGLIDAGQVYSFLDAVSGWNQLQAVSAGDPQKFGQFGVSVTVSDDVLVAGAIGHDAPTGADAGAAYVFRLRGTWEQEQRLQDSGLDDADFFGTSVAVRGSLIAVGAPAEDGPGYLRGSVYFYRNKGTQCDWVEDTARVLSDRANGDYLGGSVALGERIAIAGAVGDDGPAGFDVGSVGLFDTAELVLDITPSRPGAGDPIKFTTTFGEPGQGAMLAVVAINGMPLFQPLVLRTFDASYRWILDGVFPSGLPAGTTLTFQSYKMAACGGQAIDTDQVTVTVR